MTDHFRRHFHRQEPLPLRRLPFDSDFVESPHADTAVAIIAIACALIVLLLNW